MPTFSVQIDKHSAELTRIEIVITKNAIPTITLQFAGDLPEDSSLPTTLRIRISKQSETEFKYVRCGVQYSTSDGVVSTKVSSLALWPASPLIEWLQQRSGTRLIYQRTPSDKSLSQAIKRWMGDRFQSVVCTNEAEKRVPVGTCFLRPCAWRNRDLLSFLANLCSDSAGGAAWNALGDRVVLASNRTLTLASWSLLSHQPASVIFQGLPEGDSLSILDRSRLDCDVALFSRRCAANAEDLLNSLLRFDDPIFDQSWPLVCCPATSDMGVGHIESVRYSFAKQQDGALCCNALLKMRLSPEIWNYLPSTPATSEAAFVTWVDGVADDGCSLQMAKFRLNDVSGLKVAESWQAALMTGNELYARILGTSARRSNVVYGLSVKYQPEDAFALNVLSGQVPLAYSPQSQVQFTAEAGLRLDSDGRVEIRAPGYEIFEH